jgi:hypothetical protein
MKRIILGILMGMSVFSTSVWAEETINAKDYLPPFKVNDNGIVEYSDYSTLPFTQEEQKNICAKAEKGEYEVIEMYPLSEAPIDQKAFLDMMKSLSRIPEWNERGTCNSPEEERPQTLCMKDSYDIYSLEGKNLICEEILAGQKKEQCLVKFSYMDYGPKDYAMCLYSHFYLYDQNDKSLKSLQKYMKEISAYTPFIPCNSGEQKLIRLDSKIYIETYNHGYKKLARMDYVEISEGRFKDYPVCHYSDAYIDPVNYYEENEY